MLKFLGNDGMCLLTQPANIVAGVDALNAVDVARQQVAKVINAKSEEIIWTSGATESDNLAIKGALPHFTSVMVSI